MSLSVQYTSVFAITESEACPISPTAQTESVFHTMVPGSTLGALLNGTFCSQTRRGVLEHPILPYDTPASNAALGTP